jgi:molybdopterin synthase sulfur carrier subunit
MKVLIPTPLRSYCAERAEVVADGATLGEVLADLDVRYPGMRFRIVDEQDMLRRHVRVFVNGGEVRELEFGLGVADEVMIVQALSGG